MDSPAIRTRYDNEVDTLLSIWLRAVKSSHTFLTDTDIIDLTTSVREILSLPQLLVIEKDCVPAGFMLIDNNKIEALFIDPDYQKSGLGSYAIDYAIKVCYKHYKPDNISDANAPQAAVDHSINTPFDLKIYVDVNEQNTRALAFYQAKGFYEYSREPTDAYGRPFPIIHLAHDLPTFNSSKDKS